MDASTPAELIYGNRRPPPMMTVHSDTLLPGETVQVGAMTVTSAARTAFDIGRRTSSRPRVLQRLDALANATDVKRGDVEAVAIQHPGARGLVHLRQVLPLVDGGAESPQETRTRLVLIDAGLPTPQTQIRVFNAYGDLIGRIDMGYEEFRVGIEYDGPQHWTDPKRRARDIDRQAELEAEGWIIIRVSSDLLHHRTRTVVVRVIEAMTARGWGGRL